MPELDMKEVTKSFEDLNKGFEAFKEANDERFAELDKKGTSDPILDEKIAKIEADMGKSQEVLTKLELALKRQSRVVTDRDGNEIDLEAKAKSFGARAERVTGNSAKGFGSEQLAEYKAAFERLARKQFNTDFLTDVERKALSVGTDSAGGYLVHPDLSGRMVKKVYETSAMRAYASQQTISTDSLEGHYDNDEVGGGWVAELETRSETTTPSIGRWAITAHELSAMPKASQKLLDDAEWNIDSWLSAKISEKFARLENSAFVVGDGVDKPHGFLDYADGTNLTNSITRYQTGANGDYAPAPDGGDVLLDVLYGLKAQHRANATYFMNTLTLAVTRKLKDSNGAYLWAPGIAAGQPSTLNGYPVAVFEDMPDYSGTGALGVAVGDMRAAYQIVDRAGIRMLRDPYSSKPNVLFYATKRTGGDMINGEALKIVEFSA